MAREALLRRMRRARFAAALMAASLAASPAIAEQVTLRQVGQPAIYRPAGRAVDILGITPGMTPDEVRPVLQKQYGTVTAVQENLGLEFRGVDVATQNYVTRLTARNDGDDIVVWFATPTTGNGVVEVTRQITYATLADAPLLALVRKQFSDYYGAPAFAGPAVGTGEIELMAWSYKGDQPAGCQASSCRAGLGGGLSLADMANYQQAVRRGHELTIVSMLLASIGDPNHASSVVTTMSDAATKLHSVDAALKQMQDGATAKKPVETKPRR